MNFSTTPYSVHDLEGSYLLPSDSWVVETIELGANPNNRDSYDFSALANAGKRVLARLNFSHHGQGTIPGESMFDDYAQRIVNWVEESKGVFAIIIGNEPNYSVEWYNGIQITPQLYAKCYNKVWRAVREVSDIPITHAAVAPWNMDAGHWLDWFRTCLRLIDGKYDLINLHTYTHGVNPDLIYSEATMDAPNDKLYYHFRAFEDFLAQVPDTTHIPVIITETDQNDPWADVNSGWVVNAYRHCDWYSKQPKHHKIICLTLYRYRKDDKWSFSGKNGVITDLNNAISLGLRYNVDMGVSKSSGGETVLLPFVGTGTTLTPAPPEDPIEWDSQLNARDVILHPYSPVPGENYYRIVEGQYYDKDEAQGKIVAFFDVEDANGNRIINSEVLVTWDGGEAIVKIEEKPGEEWGGSFVMNAAGNPYSAKMLKFKSDSVSGFGLGGIDPDERYYKIHVAYGFRFRLTQAMSAPVTPVNNKPDAFNEGDKVSTFYHVNIRKTPGNIDKPEDDVLYVMPPGAIIMLNEGPHFADGLNWWNVTGHNGKMLGWIAEYAGNGNQLFDLDNTGFELYSPLPRPSSDSPNPSEAHLPAYLVNTMARMMGIEPKLARAFIDVESGDQAFAADGRPLIRFEAHVFKGQLRSDDLWHRYFSVEEKTINVDVPKQYWRPTPESSWRLIHTGNQSDEWTVFNFAASLNKLAAYKSTSFGLGQIMGFNYALLSYPSAEAMYNDFAHPQWGYYNQLVGFFSYILNRTGMLEATRSKDFRAMSILYNGSPHYEGLLRNAYNAED